MIYIQLFNLKDSCAPCSTMSQASSNYCYENTNSSSSSNSNSSNNALNSGGGGGGGVSAIGVQAGFISPRERLEAFGTDFDMLKPLLMYNIESIQTFRADCKYKKAR